jgi:hypothetical protein
MAKEKKEDYLKDTRAFLEFLKKGIKKVTAKIWAGKDLVGVQT